MVEALAAKNGQGQPIFGCNDPKHVAKARRQSVFLQFLQDVVCRIDKIWVDEYSNIS